jgi:hypothetical protein
LAGWVAAGAECDRLGDQLTGVRAVLAERDTEITRIRAEHAAVAGAVTDPSSRHDSHHAQELTIGRRQVI